MDTTLGTVHIGMEDATTPLTVANFLDNYVIPGNYNNTFIYRSVPGFVLQSGALTFDSSLGTFTIGSSAFVQVPLSPSVNNEFNISNTRGTLAMAKLGGDPNSATREWFVNLADNAGTPPNGLDFQNSGFTVFARVLGSGMDVFDAVAALPISPDSSAPPGVSGAVPVQAINSPPVDADLVKFSSIAVIATQTINTQGGVLDFGVNNPAVVTSSSFLVHNFGSSDLTIGTIDFSGLAPVFMVTTDGCSGMTLQGAANCSIEMEFLAGVPGIVSDSFSIPSDDPDTPNSAVTVTGTGAEADPTISSSVDTTLNFGLVTSPSVSETITITNIGNPDLTISAINITGANIDDFSETNDCTDPLGLTETCTITVTFDLSIGTPESALLSISSDDPATPNLDIALMGQANEPTPTISTSVGTVLDLGVVTTGPANDSITVTNVGFGSLTIGSVIISGTDPDAVGFTQTNDCTLLDQIGDSCVIDISYFPASSPPEEATLSIASSDTATPIFDITLMGTIATIDPTISTNPPTTFELARLTGNFTISNTGFTPLTIASVTFTGAEAPNLSETNTCTDPLALAESCTVFITFAPTSNAPSTATVVITSNDSSTPTKNITLEIVDSDGDGVIDAIESINGNGDFFLDSTQAATTTLLDANSLAVTLTTDLPAQFANVDSVANPSPTDTPSGVSFENGFIEFDINGITSGSAVSITLILDSTFAPNSYFKFGPTPDDPTPHWYDFSFDGTTGAQFFYNASVAGLAGTHTLVVLNFVDGERGDGDLSANGTIVDPGGPATNSGGGGGGGGGGCSLTNTNSITGHNLNWLLMLGFLLLTGLVRHARPTGR